MFQVEFNEVKLFNLNSEDFGNCQAEKMIGLKFKKPELFA